MSTAGRAGSGRPRWPPAWWRPATGIDIDEALDAVRLRKPSADPLPHQREDLRRWWEGRRGAGGG